MRRPLIRQIGPGMALLALGLLASDVVEVGSGPVLADKPYSVAKAPEADKLQVVESFGKLPLYFIENQEQLAPRVAYYIHGGDKSNLLHWPRCHIRANGLAAGEGLAAKAKKQSRRD